MRIGRTESSGEPFRFFRIKDLHFFRHLLRNYDLSLLKDYLLTSLTALAIDPPTPHHLHRDHIYVPAEDARVKVVNAEGNAEHLLVRAGHPLPSGVVELEAGEAGGLTVYAMARRTVLILEELYLLELPVTAGMKSAEKLAFLERCEVEELEFGSFAYRRGEEVDAVYFLLAGQVKMCKQLGENVYEVASLEQGRLFGLFELKSRLRHRELYAKASLNPTRILKIPLRLLDKLAADRDTTLDALLAEAKSQLFSLLPTQAPCERRSLLVLRASEAAAGSGHGADSSRAVLERRLKTFESSRMIKSSVLEGLVYNKKMLYRVKELNERMQHANTRHSRLEPEDPHAVRHFNDKWKKSNKDRAQPTQKPDTLPSRTPFKRLLKYPSVQRYLGLDPKNSSVQ